jgi:hypothetical protein
MSDITCVHCAYSNSPPGARFCANCGTALPASGGDTVVINSNVQVGEVQGGQVTGVKIGKVIGTVIFGADDETRARDRRNLRILLEKVKEFWVDGVLKSSLGGIEPLELEKRLNREAVAPPLQELAQLPTPQLPPGAPIRQTFELLDRAVLIMDGLGSGKTTTLLKLAQDAAEQADNNPDQPIPVVLNLSSWAQSRSTIAEWISEELALRYQIPVEMGKKWLDEQRLALMLDGLDEVGPENVGPCIRALNEFRKSHGLLPISICTRTEDYLAARERLQLNGALALQPLTEDQVKQYLQAAGTGADTLEELLAEDENLQPLSTSPMMLSIMCQVFAEVPAEALRREHLDTQEERRSFLLQHYIQYLFDHQKDAKSPPFSKNDTTKWLRWLANCMSTIHWSAFQVDQLQPAMLSNSVQSWLYWLLSRSLVGLLIGVVLGVTAEIAGTPVGRLGYVIAGLIPAVLMGFADGLGAVWRGRNGGMQDTGRSSHSLRIFRMLLAGIFSAVSTWVVFGLLLDLGAETTRLMMGNVLIIAVIFLQGGAFSGSLADVAPAASLKWSWKESLRGILPGLGLQLVVIAASGALFARTNSFQIWFVFSVVYGSALTLVVVIYYGLKSLDRGTSSSLGIKIAARNALRGAVLMGGTSGFLYALAFGLPPALIVAVRVGLVAAICYGGFNLIKLSLLFLLLVLNDNLPWRLVAFLDYAVRLGLLQKVGGGYRFSSRLVQDYLAHGG